MSPNGNKIDAQLSPPHFLHVALMDLMLFQGAFGQRTDLADDTSTRPENVVQKQEQAMYPERPGEPRCFDYMSHGSCRRQMNCKYHHPADQLTKKQVCNSHKVQKQYDSTYHCL
jgi:hypothetical protein